MSVCDVSIVMLAHNGAEFTRHALEGILAAETHPWEMFLVDNCSDDATPELVAKLVAAFKPFYDDSGFPNTEPYPGVPELLAAIRRAGGKTYIVTNKRHAATQPIARKFGWDRLMDGVWSYDTFEAKYKKPDLLAKLMRDLGVAAETAVMVGDTAGDVEAGRANGMATIGVTYGYGTPEEVASADYVFGTALDIAKKLVK